jgi:predicted Zn-dependent protease
MIHNRCKLFFWCLVLGWAMLTSAVQAQPVIRDAETESALRQIADPIFTAAGLNAKSVRIVLINEDTINAFVAGGQNLFLYTGLIQKADHVGELAGVIAHEAGHIAGGHLIRMRGEMEQASVESILATLAGVAVGVGSGDAQAGIGIGMGGSELARRRLLRHSRAFESAADQAALTTLRDLGYSAQGMADFMEKLMAEQALPELQRSGYLLTHPLSRNRLQTIQADITSSRRPVKTWPAAWEDDFIRLKAKILGFTRPSHALSLYQSKNDFNSRYGTAIAQYRMGKIAEALTILSDLKKQEPQNGFLDELRGQILFEQGRIGDAISAYRAALKLQPDQPLIKLALAQALLQRDQAQTSDEAIRLLQSARDTGEQRTPLVYRWLAVAYGRGGQNGMAKLALAEEALLKRDLSLAVQQATLAKQQLPKTASTARQRAEDILQQANRLKDQKK